jgi:arylsulfatase A-like enzyme
MIARWPGKLPAGAIRGGISTTMDLFTTFIELAGGKIPTDREIDGKNIMGLLEGREASPHEKLYYYSRSRLFALRQNNWKLHLFKRDAIPGEKLHDPVRCDPPELYNLAEDIAETRNRAAEHPEIVARLVADAEQFDASVKPVMKLPPRTMLLVPGR